MHITAVQLTNVLQAFGALLEVIALAWAGRRALTKMRAINANPRKATWFSLSTDPAQVAEAAAVREFLSGLRGPTSLAALGLVASVAGPAWAAFLA